MADSLIDYAPEFPSDGPLTMAALGNPTVSAYAQQSQALRQVTEMNVLGLWDATIGRVPVLDPAASDLWLNSVGPMISAAQQEEVSLTQAYMENLLSAALERRIAATLDRRVLLGNLRNGTTNGDVYYRPVKTARTVMSVGGTRTQANFEAKKRLSSLVRTDLQLARMKTSQAVMNSDYAASLSEVPEAKWHKRVLRGTSNCGLCMYASTRTYYKADLQPIHPGCDCVPMPQFTDPKKIVADPELLQQLKDIGAVDSPTQVVIYKHGEYGPTLAREMDHHLISASAEDRPTLTGRMVDGRDLVAAQTGAEPTLSLAGWTAENLDEMNRPIERDWVEIVGTREIVEVSHGPIIIGGHNLDQPIKTGRGIVAATMDNRLFYVEYDEFEYENQRAEAEERMLTLIREEAKSLPRREDGGFWTTPEVVMSVTQSKDYTRNGMTFTITADAGRGRVVHYNSEVRVETVWHENAHIVAGAVNRLAEESRTSPLRDGFYAHQRMSQSPGFDWEEAQFADREHLKSLIGEGDLFDDKGLVNPQSQVLSGGETGDALGVTPYGSTSMTEDFAESWRLAIKDTVGIVKRRDSPDFDNEFAGWEEITFKEMFPNRYAYFERMAELAGFELPF